MNPYSATTATAGYILASLSAGRSVGFMRLILISLLAGCSAISAETGPPLIPVWNEETRSLSYLDNRGRAALDTEFREGGFFNDGRARVCGDSCGYIDENGTRLFGFDFHWVGESSEGFIPFCQVREQCGFLDDSGNVIIEPSYEAVQPFRQGLAGAKKRHWGFIDGKGHWKIKPVYGSVLAFSESRASVQSTRKPYLYGIIDTSGKVLLPFKHQKIFPYSGKRARFFHWDRFGFLDYAGRIELAASLEWAEDPVAGLSYFIHEKNQGYRAGKTVVLSMNCTGGQSFSTLPVVARVMQCDSGLYAYIDGRGKEWLGGFEEATSFRNGFALIRRPGEEYHRLVNKEGEEYPLERRFAPAW